MLKNKDFKYYTSEQIVEDIFNTEGCQVKLNTGVPVYYKNLYSEVYKQGLPGDSCVDDLTKRVNGFIMDYAIPFIDKPFTLNYGIYVSEDRKTYSLLLDLSEEPKDPDFFKNNVGRPGKYASIALISNLKGQLNVETFLIPRQTH